MALGISCAAEPPSHTLASAPPSIGTIGRSLATLILEESSYIPSACPMIILTSSELRRLWSYTNSTYPVIVQPNERAVKRGVAHLVLAVSYCALTVPTVSVSRKDTQPYSNLKTRGGLSNQALNGFHFCHSSIVLGVSVGIIGPLPQTWRIE